jgi:hypothetical protein
LRKVRYSEREGTDFEAADGHAVESQAGALEIFARDVVENNHSMRAFLGAIDKLLRRNWR